MLTSNKTPTIILVNTQLPENLGAVSRSMLNFNFKRLFVVSPEFSIDHEKIKPVSAGADIVIKKMKLFNDYHDAIKGFNTLIGTTNRTRSIEQKVIDFDELLNLFENKNNEIGIIFGPERSGLNNDHVSMCDYILKIDTNKKFSSLNLSHAVALICYELSKLKKKKGIDNKITSAKKGEIINFIDILCQDLEEKKFFLVKERKKIMIQKITNIFNKISLTSDDVKILFGIFKALKKRAK